jgi:hypothetical protein
MLLDEKTILDEMTMIPPPNPEWILSKPDLKFAHEHLRKLLLITRKRSTAGYQRDRCMACDFPHSHLRPCDCPHHAAIEYLKSHGVKVD